MKIIKIFTVILITGLVFSAAYYFLKGNSKNNSITADKPIGSTVTINNVIIDVKVARSSSEKGKGLSGTAKLQENEGMIFEFIPKTKPNFWMKDMLIPLDMIWIADGKIIGIEKDVPAPTPGTPDARLELYYPSEAIDYVLEVNAGFSNKNNIKAGDSVSFNLINN